MHYHIAMSTKNSVMSVIIIVLVLLGGGLLLSSKKSSVKLNTGPVVGSVVSEEWGEYLTDSKGMTLYGNTFDKDLQSSCVDECLKNWKIFEYNNRDLSSFTDGLTKNLNVIKRTDGYMQFTYFERPLYYYVGDTKAGDVNGAGLNEGKWKIIIVNK
mgnify:FL=1